MVGSIWHIGGWELTARLLLSAVLGGLIGFEREWSNHAAGLRTHILVCLGATSIMLLSIYGFEQFVNETNVRIDPARLAAQVISGIGFLGAGAIMRNGSTVSGLTTAASIWVVAAIGLSVGAGFFYPALLTTLLALISLFALNKWEKFAMRKRRNHELMIKVPDKAGMLGVIATELGALGLQIKNIQIKPLDELSGIDNATGIVELRIKIGSHNPALFIAALEKISMLPGVLCIDSAYATNREAKAAAGNNPGE
ncbi:magnesium transporter MgtC [Gordoniibacillus kamchatkensis]|uniref:Magnesium transporter MgtC n=1 Tax=Gordoniibacillus kamchatkensis TaxID=1590651 RepID=A0ABR5AAQ3_9BACL|nr:MgtC/SapB family protein [Paenibacillus sp. VKM B-2647]KIL38045.1 magnesium transporter MgtC [Paenibacillus sp. VKM B-2647]